MEWVVVFFTAAPVVIVVWLIYHFATRDRRQRPSP
jgi:hypothetical protein